MGFGTRCPTIAARTDIIVTLDNAIRKHPPTVPVPGDPPERVPVADLTGDPSDVLARVERSENDYIEARKRYETEYRSSVISWASEREIEIPPLVTLERLSPAALHARMVEREAQARRAAYWRTRDVSHVGEIDGAPYRWTVHAPSAETVALFLDTDLSSNSAAVKANIDLIAACLIEATGDFAAEGFPAPKRVGDHVSRDWIALLPITWIAELAAFIRYTSEPDAEAKKA